MDTYLGSGWACTDCTVFLANDVTPDDWSDDRFMSYARMLSARNPNVSVTLGMPAEEHHSECPAWDGTRDVECDCETITFSWTACDLCYAGSLGGERHAVSFWSAA